MLLNMREIPNATYVMLDINEFFNKLKSIEKTTSLPEPQEIGILAQENTIFFEWYQCTAPSHLDLLRLEFDGSTDVKLIADYETLNIDITQSLPLNEDFPELVLTHLKQFKRPTKKKRYK
jgi:hypothetical protein